tara:strand:- start:38970 stop:39191 length:222 start_codon:yes stop_codon:yes gene_type:complete
MSVFSGVLREGNSIQTTTSTVQGVVKQPVLGAHPSQKLECSFFSFGGFDLFLHLAKSKAPKRTILYPVDSSYL